MYFYTISAKAKNDLWKDWNAKCSQTGAGTPPKRPEELTNWDVAMLKYFGDTPAYDGFADTDDESAVVVCGNTNTIETPKKGICITSNEGQQAVSQLMLQGTILQYLIIYL